MGILGLLMAIDITLPDGSSRSLDEGATAADLAAAIGRGLAKAAVTAEINGEEVPWPLKVGYVRLLILAGVDTSR